MKTSQEPTPSRAVGVIPARWASTRLPGKSLVPVCGKPLIQWVVEGARRARRLDTVLVATDDRRIAEVAEGLGVRAVMTREDHASGTDRVAEAVADLDADVIVNIQGDEPMVDPGLLDRLADALEGDGAWDMATAATPITSDADLRNPSFVKVVWAEDHRALYFSRSPIPFVRDGGTEPASPLHWLHLGLYAYRRSFLRRLVAEPPCALEEAEKLEQLRALHLGGRIRVLETREKAIGVDTPEDVSYVERLIRERDGLSDDSHSAPSCVA